MAYCFSKTCQKQVIPVGEKCPDCGRPLWEVVSKSVVQEKERKARLRAGKKAQKVENRRRAKELKGRL